MRRPARCQRGAQLPRDSERNGPATTTTTAAAGSPEPRTRDRTLIRECSVQNGGDEQKTKYLSTAEMIDFPTCVTAISDMPVFLLFEYRLTAPSAPSLRAPFLRKMCCFQVLCHLRYCGLSKLRLLPTARLLPPIRWMSSSSQPTNWSIILVMAIGHSTLSANLGTGCPEPSASDRIDPVPLEHEA